MWEIMHATYMKGIARLPIGIAHLHCETYLLHGKIKFVTQIFFVQLSLPMDCRLDKHYFNSIKVPTNSQWHNRRVLPLWHYLN